MSYALDDLTDKEKEALRLLLAGHDAKSSARELDISVHTVNDRLRNARRKLNVSSSREAARILGDAEGAIPQNPAHKPFGMAESLASDDPADLNETGGPSRTVWLAGGMLTMSLFIAIAAVAIIAGDAEVDTSTSAAAETEAVQDTANAEAESIETVEAFLAEIDAGDWEGSWEVAGAFFQSQLTAEQWAGTVEQVRSPLGDVASREVVGVERTDSLPGVPEGEYEVVQFRTDFTDRDAESVETVIMLEGEDGWQVAGYFIR